MGDFKIGYTDYFKNSQINGRFSVLLLTILTGIFLFGCGSGNNDLVSEAISDNRIVKETVSGEIPPSDNTADETISVDSTESGIISSNTMPDEIISDDHMTTTAGSDRETDAAVETPLFSGELAFLETNEFQTAETIGAGNEEPAEIFEEYPDLLTSTQKNSVNMLNYITVLTQEINESKGSRIYLESVYSSLINNINPNAVDTRTQAQMMSILDTLEGYRMINVKRKRLEYLYEQNRAQALRQAIPNPVGLLSAVQSGSLLKGAVSVIYMAVDSASSYTAVSSQADLQYLQGGWELDDAESAELHNSRKAAFNYMINMVRDNSLPGDYALTEETVQSFVEWKNNTNLVRKTAWLETNRETYQQLGIYWLELARAYYDSQEYEKCLDAIDQYEAVTARIFRKDLDYAKALPMAVISAKEILGNHEYIEAADRYTAAILANTNDDNWALRYFAAQIYLDLYAATKEAEYLDKSYEIAFNNVNILVGEQRSLNAAYLSDVRLEKAGKNATKREKEEIKQYNKLLKEERKTALPPVSEALYLNCSLLFALADERDIPSREQIRIESILHENGENIFLTTALDDQFWFSSHKGRMDSDEIHVTFDGDKLSVPVTCITDRSKIYVTVSGSNGKMILEDWTVKKVERPKGVDQSEFIAAYTSSEGEDYEYQAGDTITVKIIPIEELSEEPIEFTYDAVAKKKMKVLDDIVFERKIK